MKDDQKHLTLSLRLLIELGLNQNKPFSTIARETGKDPTTISKEVRKHRAPKLHRSLERNTAPCSKRKGCRINDLCGKLNCLRECKHCSVLSCFAQCSNYEAMHCPLLQKSPYVCNGCKRRSSCQMERMVYAAKYADDIYQETLRSSREGINQTADSIQKLDALISPLLLKGQPMSHIYENHKLEINCSRRTLYVYVGLSVFTARNLDLRRKVKYRQRKAPTRCTAREKAYRDGRTYLDFEKLLQTMPGHQVVEMDTVEGRKGGKVLLTMLFRCCSLMLVFLLESKTQEAVQTVFEQLTNSLGLAMIHSLFPVILTDNGSEFQNPSSLEMTKEGDRRTTIYYCDPHSSWQKGMIEKNHEFIRYIAPKGTSFDPFDQERVTGMMNHINAVTRDSLNGHTPYQLSLLLLDNKLHTELCLQEIDPDEVILLPKLLR